MTNLPTFLCPDCKRPMTQLPAGETDLSKLRWICPIAVEAQRRGILGEVGRKHKVAQVYRLVSRNSPQAGETGEIIGTPEGNPAPADRS